MTESAWGVADATLAFAGSSPWGTSDATLENITDINQSAWGTADVALVPGSSSAWGSTDATVPTETYREFWIATPGGWVPAKFEALVPGPILTPDRDHLEQPYDEMSIWNTPVGITADEKPANLPANYTSTGKISVDPISLTMDQNAPIRTFSNGTMLNKVDVGPVAVGNQVPANSKCRIYDSVTWNSGWNGLTGLLFQSTTGFSTPTPQRYAWSAQPLYRPTSANDPQAYRTGDNYPTGIRGLDDLFGDGRKGCHGGGQCGGIGGAIRAWEYDDALADGYNINHRLALNVHGVTCLSQADKGLGAGLSGPGWRWPAFKADTDFNTPGANNYYGRTTPAGVVMGSLLALPSGYDLSGITDPLVKSIGWALLKFGCHIVDVTGFTARYAFTVEKSREDAWNARPVSTFHQALMGLITDLVLIDDCTPTNPGGVGTLRAVRPAPLKALV